MSTDDPIGWLDVEEVAERLNETQPEIDPLSLRFTELRQLVESLPGFSPEPEHPVNERILEAIQAHWVEARTEMERDED